MSAGRILAFVLEEFLRVGCVAIAAAVETVSTDFAFRHADALNEVFELGKLQG